ncbi:MAG: hypothetical protein HLUCCO18_15540 [Rhodobacteraceae bacterium HLUCCO18]|nr:MAG: hypothetical protein HLUCCO18_15540 [Rhodobacteraceae bacterium HLUCCO18]
METVAHSAAMKADERPMTLRISLLTLGALLLVTAMASLSAGASGSAPVPGMSGDLSGPMSQRPNL